MTDVAFHTGLADKLAYTCRLVRKACRQGRRVEVRGSGEQLARLDPLLWTFDPSEFLPHVRLRAGQAIAPELVRTPVWLVEESRPDVAAPVLVNLGPDAAADFARYERVVELVGTEDVERREGRQRWRYYEGQGMKPEHVTSPSAAPG